MQALIKLSIFYNQSDSVQSLSCARRALALARQQPLDSMEGKALTVCGNALYYQGKPTAALGYYQQALAQRQRLGLWQKAADSYLSIGAAQVAAGHLGDAIEAYQQAMRLYRRAGNWARVAGCYSNVGIAYYEQVNYPAALRCYLAGLRIAERGKYTAVAGLLLINIASLYERQDNPQQALNYDHRALRLFRAAHNQLRVSEVLNNLGMLYTARKEYAQARQYLEENLQLEKKLGNWSQKATTLLWLGELHAKQGRFAQSLPVLRQAAALCQQLGMHELHATALYDLATAYQQTGQLLPALGYARQGLRLAQTQALPFEVVEALELLAKLSAARQDSAAAYRYQQRYQVLKDSLSKQENLQQLGELQTRYETQKKEAQIGLLQRNATLQQAYQRGQLRLRNLLVGSLLLAALLGALYFQRYRQQRRANRQLRAQEMEIAAQNAEITAKNDDLTGTQRLLRKSLSEKDVLLKEVHHRVKNNLQIISSLLNIQAREQQPPQVTAVLREGQSWIKSIALIHEMLYRSDDLVHISAQQFLERLTGLQRHTLGSQGIQIAVQAADISLNTSTAVPLGLIVNELIANAYKHAFSAGGAGHISVRLEAAEWSHYQLSVCDDGVGLPAGFSLDFTSLGLELVKDLTGQLDGTLRVRNGPGNGTCFLVSFQAVAEAALSG